MVSEKGNDDAKTSALLAVRGGDEVAADDSSADTADGQSSRPLSYFAGDQTDLNNRRTALVFFGTESSAEYMIYPKVGILKHAESFKETVIHSLLSSRASKGCHLSSRARKEKKVVEVLGVSQKEILTLNKCTNGRNKVRGELYNFVRPPFVLGTLQKFRDKIKDHVQYDKDSEDKRRKKSSVTVYQGLNSGKRANADRVVSGKALVDCIIKLKGKKTESSYFSQARSSHKDLFEYPIVTIDRMLRLNLIHHQGNSCYHWEPDLLYILRSGESKSMAVNPLMSNIQNPKQFSKSAIDSTEVFTPGATVRVGGESPASSVASGRSGKSVRSTLRSPKAIDMDGRSIALALESSKLIESKKYCIIKEGYLNKLNRRGRYQPRYVTIARMPTQSLTIPGHELGGVPGIPQGLGEHVLRWHRKVLKRGTCKGEMELARAEVEEDEENGLGFRIVTPWKNMRWRAGTIEEKKSWIDIFNSILPKSLFSVKEGSFRLNSPTSNGTIGTKPMKMSTSSLYRFPSILQINLHNSGNHDFVISTETPRLRETKKSVQHEKSTESVPKMEAGYPKHIFIDSKRSKSISMLMKDVQRFLAQLSFGQEKYTSEDRTESGADFDDMILTCENGQMRRSVESILETSTFVVLEDGESPLYIHPTNRLVAKEQRTRREKIPDISADIVGDCIMITDKAILQICQGFRTRRLPYMEITSVALVETSFRCNPALKVTLKSPIHGAHDHSTFPGTPPSTAAVSRSRTPILEESQADTDMEDELFDFSVLLSLRSLRAGIFLRNRIGMWLRKSGYHFLRVDSDSSSVMGERERRRRSHRPAAKSNRNSSATSRGIEVKVPSRPSKILVSDESQDSLGKWICLGDPYCSAYSIKLDPEDTLDLIRATNAYSPGYTHQNRKNCCGIPVVMAMGFGDIKDGILAGGENFGGKNGWCFVKLQGWSGSKRIAIHCSYDSPNLTVQKNTSDLSDTSGMVKINLGLISRAITKPEKKRLMLNGVNSDGVNATPSLFTDPRIYDHTIESMKMGMMWFRVVLRERPLLLLQQMFSRHVRSLSANASNLQNIPEADRKDSSNGEKELVSEPTNIISENCIDGIGPKSLHRVAIQIDSLKLPSAETSRLCRLILTLKGHAPLFTPNVTMYPPTSPLKELGCALPPNKTNQSAFSNPSLASPTIAMNSINIGTIFSLHLAGNEGKFEIVVEMKEKHYADAVWKQVATTGDVSFSQFFPGFAMAGPAVAVEVYIIQYSGTLEDVEVVLFLCAYGSKERDKIPGWLSMQIDSDSYNNLHSLMNWRTPHRSLAAVTAWLFVVWNLHWTTLLLLILLTYLVSTFTAYHLMRGIMRWEKGMYSTNFIEKYVSAYIKAPDDKEVDSNGTQLDSVRTETISLQSKSGEYVQLSGVLSVRLLTKRSCGALNLEKFGFKGHLALNFVLLTEHKLILNTSRLRFSSFFIRYLYSAEFLLGVGTIAESSPLSIYADDFCLAHNSEDPARTLVFMGCLAIASILIIFVQDRHLLAFVGLVEFLKSPLVWWYNKVVRPSLASNMSDPVDLLYSHRPSTKVSNSKCIKKSLNIDQGEDFKGD
eukprot:jgi/Bigna1/91637/estExt_fgenesh1_pg.C_1100016